MNKNNDIQNLEFGVPKSEVPETTEEQLALEQQYLAMFLNIGQSTYEWAMYATRDEYTKHMLELYDHLHPNESGIVTPKKEIILPS